ncbi:MAG: hypothetical protein CVU39_24005 [Chloroflexi bacterium HGW-Chloroflexi-10]|nr:MAG: hypothetical protein CVU39_24005 [Chloroflexi bacterium HGW-Chloroflexi-10]
MKNIFFRVGDFFRKVGRALRTAWQIVFPGPLAWKGAAWGLLIGSVLFWVVLFLFGISPASSKLAHAGLILSLILASGLGAFLLTGLFSWFSTWHKFFRWSFWVAVIMVGATLFFQSSPGVILPAGIAVVILISGFLGAGVYTLLRGGWGQLSTARRVVLIAGLVFGLGLFGSSGWWLMQEGVPGPQSVNAARTNIESVTLLDRLDPSLPGSYKVLTTTYGSGKDLHRPEYADQVGIISRSVDGTPFLQGWEGLAGWYLRNYWGFDLESLPLNGRVWYPEGEGPFPLVLVVHGNHMQDDFSDPGYDYLGELLASRGMIVVSVDENFINAAWTNLFDGKETSNQNDARGWLLLEHLRLWKLWNNEPDQLFYKKVDWDHLALIGHSRGGEAVAEAAHFNRLPNYPDNAYIRFNYNYPIQAVIAIAPVDDQYNPGGWETPLEDVNYMVIQGSMDGDLTSFDGMGQYNRVHFNDGGENFKAAVYVHGANHGQYNTTWGRSDMGEGFRSALLNREPILPVDQQEKTAEVFISAFLEAALHEDRDYLQVFRDWRSGRAWLPDTIYLTRYADADFIPVATFEEDLNVITGTLEGTETKAFNIDEWSEAIMRGKWDQSMSTSAVRIGWDARGESVGAGYAIELPKEGFNNLDENSYLVFSMADSGEDPNPEKADDYPDESNANGIDWTVELRSGKEISRVPLSEVMLLQARLDVQIDKAAFMSDLAPGEAVFQTLYIPLSAFTSANPQFDPTEVDTIRFNFDKSRFGFIWLDEIGFWNSEN